MIHYNPKSWFSLIFQAYSRQVFRRLFPLLLAVGVLTALVCYIELEFIKKPLELSNVVHSLLGFVLSLFLVFVTFEICAITKNKQKGKENSRVT